MGGEVLAILALSAALIGLSLIMAYALLKNASFDD